MAENALDTIRYWIFRVAGIGLILFVGVWALSTHHFIQSTSSAPGQVTRLRAGGSHPEIEFQTVEGKTISYGQNGFIFGYRVGDRVTVLYDPQHPYDASIDTFGALWGFHVIILLMGLVFIIAPGRIFR